MKLKTILITTTSLAGLGALGWWFYRKGQQNKPGPKVPDEPSDYDSRSDRRPKKSAPLADEFPLRFGSQGRRVERLQIWLMRNFGHSSPVNGLFDERTEKQLFRHLKRRSLDETTYLHLEMDKPVHQQKIHY